MPGICARCDKTVYFNEEKMAIGKSFHKTCFLCANKSCGRRLDSSNLTEHNSDVYCRPCYGKLFGPKGYGFGAGTLTMESGVKNGSEGTVGSANSSPVTTPSPATSPSPVPPLSPAETPSPTPPPSTVTQVTAAIKQSTNGSVNGSTNAGIKPRFGGSDICPRCNKAVYMAEKMMGGGSAWHKTSCFNCKECHKRLESTTLCEKDREIYCKTCYGKNWGPKGYGYGVGAGALKSC